MERSRRLYDLWSWIVPFRAVAEAESVSEASRSLHVASSALSRSVKLLEESIGRPLFDRRPGGLKLNESGRQLLTAVRTAMRILDDGLPDEESAQLSGAAYVSAPGELFPIIVGAIAEVSSRHPGISPYLEELGDADSLAALRRGDIDVAVVSSDTSDEVLAFRPLTPLKRCVCVAPGHPAARSGAATLSSLEFVVTVDDARKNRDGFPGHLDRKVALRVANGAAAVELVRNKKLAALMPRATAQATGLVPVRVDVEFVPLSYSVALRPCVDQPGAADEVADALCATLGSAPGAPAS